MVKCFCYWWWRFTVAAKDFYLCRIYTWQLQSKTRGWGSDNTALRGGDGGEHRDEASGPGLRLPLLSDTLLHSGRFTSLRKHRIPRRSSWGSPTPAVSDAHPEFLGRCSNVRLWTSFKLEYVLDKIRGKFRFTDLGSRLKESSFILPIVFLFLIKHRSGSEHKLQTRRHAVRNSCHLKLAFMWPLHWSRSNSPDALKTQRKVAKRRAATTSSIGSH